MMDPEADVGSDPESELLLPATPEAPSDRFRLVHCSFFFLGIATLMPWNFLITDNKYFLYKLRNTSLPPHTRYDDPRYETDLQKMFEGYLSVVSTGSNLLCMFITTLLIRSVSHRIRMIYSLLSITVLFALTAALTKVNSDQWETNFLVVTLLSAGLINGSTAVLNGSVFGLSCLFPQKYTQAIMTGMAAGGTFAALANILALDAGASLSASSFGYFLTATCIALLALLIYLLLYYNRFAKFYLYGGTGQGMHGINSSNISAINELMGHKEYFKIMLKEIWKDAISVCLVFTVTLACFPAVASSIQSLNYSPYNVWTGRYFTPVVCFLLFNLCDWVGRHVSGVLRWPKENQPNLLLVLCFLRIVLIPLIMLCNAQPRNSLPVLFNSDAYPVAFIFLLGITNGYLGTLAVMYASRRVAIGQAEGTGAVMSLSLTLGLALGSMISVGMVHIL